MYTAENYSDNMRFNNQYQELHDFLQAYADSGHNEHFHWGRLDWMMSIPYLDMGRLSKNALFRDENGKLAGAALYDTDFGDRWYLLHAVSDENLLRQMVQYVIETEDSAAPVKANLADTALCGLLEKSGFEKQHTESVLEIELPHTLSCPLPEGFSLSEPDAEIDTWQWQLVTYRGFNHEGTPGKLSAEDAEAERHLEIPAYIKVFAMKGGEYTAHCGVWYRHGDTAYIEPVVTVPEHRDKGLGRAVVYEAINRAGMRGAKRAIVLSDQEFYFHIGMTESSQVATWVKNS